jgi:Dolichyl-phosphate-mannose-protein mannosyltransferase
MQMPSEGFTDPAGSDRSSGIWPGLLIAAMAVVVYLPAFAAGFNADDYLILGRVKSIEGVGAPLGYFKFAFYEYFRPIGFLSYALDWRIWHLNPFGFHLTNVGLHAANSFLVFALARRLFSRRDAALAALLFALHPASHELVYWIAARFDLLATFFILVALACLIRPGLKWQLAGTLAFGFALMSKESAISLVIIAPAWDALIARRDWRTTARRLVPLLAVVAVYAAARTLGADLDAAGGARRLPKVLMTGVGIAGVLWLARAQQSQVRGAGASGTVAVMVVGIVAALAAALGAAGRSGWIFEKIGFAGHVVFYSLSPVVFPAPSPEWFSPTSFLQSLPVILTVFALAVLGWRAWRREWTAGRNELTFVAVFVLAALLPVSSMTGGLRYLYLPGVGVALLAAAALSRVPKSARVSALAVIALILVISVQQIHHAGRAWRAASTMTRDGVLLMAHSIDRCGSDDVLLLTTPVGIGDVYANLSWDAFDVLANCTPRSFLTVLRVMRSDVSASVTLADFGTVEVRVPSYSGNIVASRDLRNFVVPIDRGSQMVLETPAGRLETFPEGTTQVFRLTLTPEAQKAKRFYYSDGRIRQ